MLEAVVPLPVVQARCVGHSQASMSVSGGMDEGRLANAIKCVELRSRKMKRRYRGVQVCMCAQYYSAKL